MIDRNRKRKGSSGWGWKKGRFSMSKGLLVYIKNKLNAIFIPRPTLFRPKPEEISDSRLEEDGSGRSQRIWRF